MSQAVLKIDFSEDGDIVDLQLWKLDVSFVITFRSGVGGYSLFRLSVTFSVK